MTDRIQKGGLQVASVLIDLVADNIAPGTGIDPEAFWASFEEIVNELGPKNKALLQKREDLQSQIDAWHLERKGQDHNAEDYKTFLTDIGYLVLEGGEFEIATADVDPEIAEIAGSQLVVPTTNARFALNAANARWGSLYDALYGTDVISEDNGCERAGAYNPTRGAAVIAYAADVLDQAVPLASGSHKDAAKYALDGGSLAVTLAGGSETGLADDSQFAGYVGDGDLSAVLLKNNGLHIEIQIDSDHPIGKDSAAGVKDVVMEAAITTIQDFEDSVAAVDAEDKALVYSNMLGLMKGDLEDTFQKGGEMMTRAMNPDRTYSTPDGGDLTLPGRSLLLIRNVGHLMTNPAILDKDGNEVPEGIMDAMMTGLICMHDLKHTGNFTNSRTGSIYIVKPKMHGPEEAAFTSEIFARVEDALGLDRNVMKMGIMLQQLKLDLVSL